MCVEKQVRGSGKRVILCTICVKTVYKTEQMCYNKAYDFERKAR